MGALIFEYEEVLQLVEALNNMQILFHPKYMEIGKIEMNNLSELRSKDIMIFIDSNILSPIYELSKYGKTNDENGLIIASSLILFSKIIGARITSGLALIENESNSKQAISSKEKVQYYLHAINNFPPMLWKDITWGNIDTIPVQFRLKNIKENNIDDKSDNVYKIENNIHFIQHKIALIKMVYLLKTEGYSFETFYYFFNWYIDNLLICESLIVYAAMVFGNIEGVKAPKNINSSNYNKVLNGIENQAWDIHHLSQWSTFYGHEDEFNKVNFFATNDTTLKYIIINSIFSESIDSICCVFNDDKQCEKIISLVNSKLGSNRICPLDIKNTKDTLKTLDKLLLQVNDELLSLFK